MKINTVEIQNFRNIDHVELFDFESLLLFGQVGQGKTSVLEAIRLCLLGECELTPEIGKRSYGKGSARNLVRDGEKEALIKITVGDLLVQLSISNKGDKAWFCADAGTGEELDIKTVEDFWAYFEIPFDHARIAMMPGRFLLSTELGDVLATHLAGDIDPERLNEITGDHADWIEEFAVHQRIGRLDSIEKFQTLGAKAYTRRTEVNKDLKDTNRDLESMGHVVAPTDQSGTKLTTDNIEAIKEVIEKAHAKISDANIRKGRAAERVDPKAAEEEYLAACDEDRRLGDLLREAQVAHETAQADLTQAEAARATVVSETRAAKMASHHALATLDSVMDESGACPTCQRKYSEAVKKKLTAPLHADLKMKEEAYLELSQASEATLKGLAPLQGFVKETRDEVDTICGQMTVNQHEVGRLAKLKDQGAGESVTDIDAEILMLGEKIQRCEDYLVRLEQIKKIEDMKYFLDEAQIEHGHLEWAIGAFKDGKAIKGMVAGGSGEFTHRCNHGLKKLGYEMAIEVEGKKVAILLKAPDMGFRPVALCSTGQQMLAQSAMAFAFSEETSAPVLLDNLNDLDAQFRQKLIFEMKAMTDGETYRATIIGAAAWQQTKEDMSLISQALAPIKVAWVNEGIIEVWEVVA